MSKMKSVSYIVNCKHVSFCIDVPQSSVSKDLDTTEVIVIIIII